MSLAPLVDIIEAAYDVDSPDEVWLEGLAAAARPLVDGGLGVISYLYDARDPAAFQMLTAHLPDEVDPVLLHGFLSSVPPEYVAKTWARPFGLASATEGFEGQLSGALEQMFGARDVLAINGLDTGGFGLWLGALLPARARMSADHAAL